MQGKDSTMSYSPDLNFGGVSRAVRRTGPAKVQLVYLGYWADLEISYPTPACIGSFQRLRLCHDTDGRIQ
jgi:hypothetical protein